MISKPPTLGNVSMLMVPKVDDKAAKSLLGDSFKRQLKMDGGYHSVTFICSSGLRNVNLKRKTNFDIVRRMI